ncbi:tyrosine-type recombinase/integrase [Gordonia sp. LUNF6]|uniref:tyrosine-type recombinase/integrase n=1 Tax=Gordonia sp. LUNF6 TaxID=3388658 RepID=UPI00399AACC2
MAYIRAHETTVKSKGRAVKRYEVVWREPVRDEYGLPVKTASGKPKLRARQESYPTRDAAEARRDELNAAKHSGTASALADQKIAGDLPFGHYAKAWIDSQALKVVQGRLKQRTLNDYENVLRLYSLQSFGGKAIGSITPHDCELFLAGLVSRQSRQSGSGALKPATVKHAWGAFRRVMKYATQQGALTSNPCDRVDFGTGKAQATGDAEQFEAHPLTAQQVAQVSAAVAGEIGDLPAYPIYALMVDFLAYSGLRAAENAGLEVRDLHFTTRPGSDSKPTVRCSVKVERTKTRRNREWITGTPKSKKSRRTVPLPQWLAERLHAYLRDDHPRADEPTAPLWPNRRLGGGHRVKGERFAAPHDWSNPITMDAWYRTILKPALEAVGLPASRPATKDQPAQLGCRVHDLRHTFATMQLSSGVHFMQVSKWLGHGSFVLTLDTYGDWIPEEDGGAMNNLPEPTAPASAISTSQTTEDADAPPSNVIQLFG